MPTRAAVWVSGAVLVAIGATGAGSAAPAPPSRARPSQVSVAQRDSGSSRRRPFEHRRHERVWCTACHGSGATHRTSLVRTPRDCASCHHEERGDRPCARCHASDGLPQQRWTSARLSFGVWDSARTRVLPFPHDLHARPASGVACVACHATPVTRAMNRTCASCHAEHHRPEATCTSCHVPPRAGVHRASAHRTCAGSGCHAATVAPPPTLSRTLCLSCHAAQANHEPQGTCAACHEIPAAGHRRTTRRDAAGRAGDGERAP